MARVDRNFARAFAALISALATLFVLSQVYRNTNALIAPELAVELGLSPAALGGMGAAFFFTFALMQLPTGILIDRWGPRRAIARSQFFAVAGMVLASASHSISMLTLAMALMAIGAAGNLVGSLVVCGRWLPSDRFATIAGVMIALGGIGHVLATKPLALVIQSLGWRGTYLLLAGLVAIAGLVVYVVVRDAPPGKEEEHDRTRPRESLLGSLRGTWEVLRSPDLRHIMVMTALGPAALFTLRALWAGPFFADVYGLDPEGRGDALFFMAAGIILGNLMYGPLDRRFDTRRGVVTFGAICLAMTLTTLALVPAASLGLAIGLMGLIGVFATFDVVLFAHGRSLFPPHLAGRAVTTVNLALFIGVGLLQFISGFVVREAHAHGLPPADAYRLVFAMLAVSCVSGLLLYRTGKDAPPSGDRWR